MKQVGKYQLVTRLATGGMAEVFLARAEGPMGFEKTLVLKRILPHLAEDPVFVGMFLTEARVAAQLNHPNIVQIFDFGQADGTYYLAMEHIDGPDLRTLSARAVKEGVPLPPAICAKLASAACEGLAFAHDFVDPSTGQPLELVHRDISADNILLSRQGAVKVVDFGIAKATTQSHKTKTGTIKGKIAYMPVEQLQGQPLDRRADVYAMGVVLYELLTGRYPFEATTDVSMMQAILFEPLVSAAVRRPELPEVLVRILDKALAKVREQRYPDCIAFQADLDQFILSTGQPVGARDLAQWVERLCPRNATPVKSLAPGDENAIGFEPTLVSTHPGSMAVALDDKRPATQQFGETRPQPDAPVTAAREPETRLEPTRISQTKLPPVPESTEAPPPAARGAANGVSTQQAALPVQTPGKAATPEEQAPVVRRHRMGLALGALVLLGAGSGLLFFRGDTTSEAPTAPAPMPATPPSPLGVEPRPAVEAAAHPAEPQPEPPVEKPEPESAQAAAPVAPEPPAPEPAAPVTPHHKVAQKTKLEFRIRPYATVLLDGTALGQTPLAPVQVSAGTHTVRLINRELGKDVTRTIEVKAGQPNIIKQDLAN